MTPPDEASAAAPRADDPRQRKLLEAALTVFGRYGFRKSSMEEIARAAEISRQALYLRFPTKEALFTATLRYVLEGSLEAALASLADGARPLDGRLAGALDAWIGRFVGVIDARAIDLEEASNELMRPLAADYETRLIEAVIKAIRGAGLVAAYKLPGLTARQLATTLYATAKGLKYRHKSRAAFAAELALAARVMCAPLRGDG